MWQFHVLSLLTVLHGGTPGEQAQPTTDDIFTHAHVCVSVCVQWTTDQDILAALRRAGYGMVRAIKMYENRGNGQFKG